MLHSKWLPEFTYNECAWVYYCTFISVMLTGKDVAFFFSVSDIHVLGIFKGISGGLFSVMIKV